MQPVERTDPDGVDFGWVMQVTFVTTILVGAPVVAVLSAGVELQTWEAMASFAVRVGAIVWFLTAIAVYLYARRHQADTDSSDGNGGPRSATRDDDSPTAGDDA